MGGSHTVSRTRRQIVGGQLLPGERGRLLLVLGVRAQHAQRGEVCCQGEAVKSSWTDAALQWVWELLGRGHGVRLHMHKPPLYCSASAGKRLEQLETICWYPFMQSKHCQHCPSID